MASGCRDPGGKLYDPKDYDKVYDVEGEEVDGDE